LTGRNLTAGEWSDLSVGLAAALKNAGVAPRIEPRAHAGAFVARVWRGAPPIMAVGKTIWWPHARSDFAGRPEMALLQHELQHLLDFAEGSLTTVGYLLTPRHWKYGYDITGRLEWDRLGAEQRASLAEDLWRSERSLSSTLSVERLRSIIPWARGGR
jgi:hypothetical protein